MCDYSLHAIATREAKVNDELVSSRFTGTNSKGFACKTNPEVAVCLLPGTELAFENDVTYDPRWLGLVTKRKNFRVGKFAQRPPSNTPWYRDMIEFPDGTQVLVNRLCEGQRVTVLQLPVTEAKRAAQETSAVASPVLPVPQFLVR